MLLTCRRPSLVTAALYAAVLVLVLAMASPVAATHNLDVLGFENVGSCSSGTNYYFTQAYNDFTSIGWNDRISAFKATTDSASGQFHEHYNWGGIQLPFSTGSCDSDLTNNTPNWNDLASSISKD